MAARRGAGAPPAPSFSGNRFSNDGSFLEMFKRQMEQKNQQNEHERLVKETNSSNTDKSSSSVGQESSDSPKTEKPVVLPIVGKRKSANRPLKTGIVAKKPKPEKKDVDSDGSAWSKYLAEVNEYKSKMCMDEDKSRPLVK
ncbi:telomerase RNA component interacting RNase-like [Argopecten irradians]|uniref:telomerase RNA component interacting RNase-like n=1 Tax=Argopecten irradians TaxID=31199 RepID=UPI00371FE9BC